MVTWPSEISNLKFSDEAVLNETENLSDEATGPFSRLVSLTLSTGSSASQTRWWILGWGSPGRFP